MAFTHFTIITTLLFGLSQLANATLHQRGAHNSLTKRFACPTGQVTSRPQCCSLYPIVQKLQAELFEGGQCNEEARSALRLSFHDAIGYSLLGGKGGGADGSILLFNKTENAYAANGGIDDITESQYPFFVESGLSAGDFVHLAAAVGTANCAGAPRLKFMYGRPPPKVPAPDHTVPEPTDGVSKILLRFADAGFSPREAVALLASHSIAAADVIDRSIPGTPFDSTIETFDSQVYLEVLLKGKVTPDGKPLQPGEVLSPLPGEMRLQSDWAISQDLRTACYWQLMIDNQNRMMSEFKDAMAKLQVLGQDTRKLTDCTEVIPIPKPFGSSIKYPASFSQKDLQVACPLVPVPKLKTSPGPAPTVAAVKR